MRVKDRQERKTMDPEDAQFSMKLIKNIMNYRGSNRSNRTCKLPSLPKKNFDTMTPEKADKVLQKMKLLKFKNKDKTDCGLNFLNVNKSKRLFKLLLKSKKLSEMKLASVEFWGSIITDKDIQLLMQNGREFTDVVLISCTFESRLLRELSTRFSEMRLLILDSVPIGHQEIKSLMKIDMPLLYYLQIGNAFITADCRKLLSKRSKQQISRFAINLLPNGNEHTFLQAASLNIRLFQITHMLFVQKLAAPFLFANHLAKFQRESCDPISMKLNCCRRQPFPGYEEKSCMIPQATLKSLEKIITFEWL